MAQETKETPGALLLGSGGGGGIVHPNGDGQADAPSVEIPVIVHTLRAVQAAPSVGEIILVTREDLIVPMSQLCQDYAISKVTKVVRGGASRTQPVRLGTLEVSGDAQVIAIHDGARPFVSAEVIERVVARPWRLARPHLRCQ